MYSALYNSSGTEDGVQHLQARVQGLIGHHDTEQVHGLTRAAVNKAACLLKPRNDVSGSFTSDALLNAPDVLFSHL